MKLFDPDKGAELRDQGIRQADLAADADWKDYADVAVRAVAVTEPFITTDDIYAWLQENAPGVTTPERRAMGAVMHRARKDKIIEPTGMYEPTARPEGHRNPKRVWRSMVWEGLQDLPQPNEVY